MRDIKLHKDSKNPYFRASDKMINYAALICFGLHLTPPDYQNFEETRDFINENKPKFNELSYKQQNLSTREDWDEYNSLRSAKANVSEWKLHNVISQYLVVLLDYQRPPFENNTDIKKEAATNLASDILESKFKYTNRIESASVTKEELITIISEYILDAVPRLKEKHYKEDISK